MRTYIILLFCLLFAPCFIGKTWAYEVQYDSLELQWRKFDQKKINHLKQDKKYNYTKEIKNNIPSNHYFEQFMRRFLRRLSQLLFSDWAHLSLIDTLIRIVIYLLFFGFIIIVLLQVFNIRNLFAKRHTSTDLAYSVEAENVHTLDFANLLQEAVKNKQYRLAVRLQYLYSLKKLSDQQCIDWKPEKTNLDYLKELNKSYKKNFVSLTHIFDWVWYGDHSIDEQDYLRIETQFMTFNKSINSGEK